MRTLCCLLLAAVIVSGQTSVRMLVSLARPGTLVSGAFPALHPAALLQFTPGRSQELRPWWLRQSLEVVVGDADGNGAFDDSPGNVDALTWLPGAGSRSVYDLLVSFSAASTRLPGGRVKDGDLVRLLPGGAHQVVVSEGTLASLTGTSTIDVDAAAFLPTGELVFSFADNEKTTHPELIRQNGGNALLGDETVLGWVPGTKKVRIVYTPAAVLSFVSTARGRKVSTVVDLVGLAPDPVHPGHLLFTVASRSTGLVGAVFTTAGGGAYARLNGRPLTGAGAWGLRQAATLDALTLLPPGGDGLHLFVRPETTPYHPAATVTVHVRGGVPGGSIQLFAAYAVRPAPRPFGITPPLGPIGLAYLTPGDPILLRSAAVPAFRLSLDMAGRAQATFPLGPHPAGVSFVLQGVDLSSYAVSPPVAVDVVRP